MTEATTNDEHDVLATEDAYVAAEVAADETELRRLVDDRFVFNRSDGTTSDREALIRGVVAMKMTGQTLDERSVLIEGDVALVFGTADIRTAAADGSEASSVLRYTSTYVRRAAGWRLLALQMQGRAG